MERQRLIDWLQEHGMTVADRTDSSIMAALESFAAPPPSSEVEQVRRQIDALKSERDEERTIRISHALDELVKSGHLPTSEMSRAFDRAFKDETYLDEIRERPTRRLGARPLDS